MSGHAVVPDWGVVATAVATLFWDRGVL